VHCWINIESHCDLLLYLVNELKYQCPFDFYKLENKFVTDAGGRSLLMTYYHHSSPLFVQSVFPEIHFDFWRFSHTPKHKWEERSIRMAFLRQLEIKIGVRDLFDWYEKLTQAVIYENGGKTLLKQYYSDSPFKFLYDFYPHHKWEGWRFSVTPKGFWKVEKNQNSYFHWFLSEISKRGHAQPEHLYFLSTTEVKQLFGSSLLSVFFGNSVEIFVRWFMPELKWMIWRFWRNRKKWNEAERIHYFNFLKQKNGGHIEGITHSQMRESNSMLQRYYKGSVAHFLSSCGYISVNDIDTGYGVEIKKMLRDVLSKLMTRKDEIKSIHI